MERLTKKRKGENVIPLREDGKIKWTLCSAVKGDASLFLYGEHADKLAEYEDLEEQGKLLKLPAPVGSLVYEPYHFLGEGSWEIDVHKIRLEDLDKIGKSVFLTREEAEAALKELEGRK